MYTSLHNVFVFSIRYSGPKDLLYLIYVIRGQEICNFRKIVSNSISCVLMWWILLDLAQSFLTRWSVWTSMDGTACIYINVSDGKKYFSLLWEMIIKTVCHHIYLCTSLRFFLLCLETGVFLRWLISNRGGKERKREKQASLVLKEKRVFRLFTTTASYISKLSNYYFYFFLFHAFNKTDENEFATGLKSIKLFSVFQLNATQFH